MPGVLELISVIGGMVFPPVMDFVKKKFLKPSSDSPEATMSTLATTSPEVLPKYMEAMAGWLEAQTKFFNRDVVGTPSTWVVDARAAIRPIGTILCIVALVADTIPGLSSLDQGTRVGMLAIVGNWFGTRLYSGGE